MGWIGCDLDETLAEYEDGMAARGEVGKPIPKMVRRIKKHLKDGWEVRIFTARMNVTEGWDHERQREVIQAWCLKHLGQVLEVTNMKDYGMIFLYDDRAVGVEPRTGRLLSKPPKLIRRD
jgi:hypothetical protein